MSSLQIFSCSFVLQLFFYLNYFQSDRLFIAVGNVIDESGIAVFSVLVSIYGLCERPTTLDVRMGKTENEQPKNKTRCML